MPPKKETMEEGSPEEEAAETPAEETAEQEAGEGDSSDGVKLPEDFQKQAHSFVSGLDTDAKIRYVQDCCNEQMSKLMSSEAGTDEYSEADMPK